MDFTPTLNAVIDPPPEPLPVTRQNATREPEPLHQNATREPEVKYSHFPQDTDLALALVIGGLLGVALAFAFSGPKADA